MKHKFPNRSMFCIRQLDVVMSVTTNKARGKLVSHELGTPTFGPQPWDPNIGTPTLGSHPWDPNLGTPGLGTRAWDPLCNLRLKMALTSREVVSFAYVSKWDLDQIRAFTFKNKRKMCYILDFFSSLSISTFATGERGVLLTYVVL